MNNQLTSNIPQITPKTCTTSLKHISTTLSEATKTSISIFSHVQAFTQLYTDHTWATPQDTRTLALAQQSTPITQLSQQSNSSFLALETFGTHDNPTPSLSSSLLTVKTLENRFEHLSDTYYALHNNIKTNIEQLTNFFTLLTDFSRSITTITLQNIPQLTECISILLSLQHTSQSLLSVLHLEMSHFDQLIQNISSHTHLDPFDTNISDNSNPPKPDISHLSLIKALIPAHNDAVLAVQALKDSLSLLIQNLFENTL